MALPHLNIFNRTKFRIAERVFPIKSPSISLLDALDLKLPNTIIDQINIPSISKPNLSDNFCPEKNDAEEVDVSPFFFIQVACKDAECGKIFLCQCGWSFVGKRGQIKCPFCDLASIYDITEDLVSLDFSSHLEELELVPQIESISLLLKGPSIRGKQYKKIDVAEAIELFTKAEGSDECVHGLKKSWCSICIDKVREESEVKSSRCDLFDLILPILQPPLGDNFDSPLAFPKPLFDFQRVGIKFLIERERALLGDEMGLGKTAQVISALRFLFRLGKIHNCLILCPRSVLGHWEKELGAWGPELNSIEIRGTREQRRLLWSYPAHVYVTTYETLRQDLPSAQGITESLQEEGVPLFEKEIEDNSIVEKQLDDIVRREFDLIVLDEIQKIKNPKAEITKAARRVDASLRWGLSGTPLENRLEELIAIFAYLKPGLLTYRDATRPSKVKKAIEPYFLRRRKVDAYKDLPEKVHDEIWLHLSPSQREAYDLAEKEGIIALNKEGDSVTVQHILALITKLKQICNIDQVSKESSKLEYLLEALEEIVEQDDKALVCSQYTEKTIYLLEPYLAKFNPIVYSGSLSDQQRKRLVRKFQEEEQNKVLLMSVKAGGLGITLTRACYVFHFDHWWNPATSAQAEDRTHRIGQMKTVFVTSLLTKDTIEQKIQDLLKRKRELFNEVIDDLSDTGLANTLTEDELFGLFGLKRGGAQARTKGKKEDGSKRNLEDISPEEFEKLIGELYRRMGFQAKLTSVTRDSGVDIYASRISESGAEYLAIQCKHYPKGIVGVEHARALYGVIQSQQHITRGVLVTSGDFSRDCREFASGKRIQLIDGIYLKGLLEKYSTSL